MVQNSPEAPRGAAKESQEQFNLINDSESIRNALGIEDTDASPEDWMALLATLVSPLKHPDDSRIPQGKEALSTLFRKISPSISSPTHLHTKVVQSLADAKNAVSKKVALTEDEIHTIMVNIATYYEARYQYEAMWEGKIASGRSVPAYLAEYIDIRDTEVFAFRVVKNLLPIQYDVMEKAGYSPITKKEDKPWFRNSDRANQLSLRAINKQLSLQVVLDCFNPDGSMKTEEKPYMDFLLAAGVKKKDFIEVASDGNEKVKENHLRSVKLLVGFITKHKKKIAAMASFQGVPEKDLTISQAIEASADTALFGRFAAEIVNAAEGFNPWLGDKMPDLGNFAKDVFDEAENYPDRALQIALRPLIELAEKRDAEKIATEIKKDPTKKPKLPKSADDKKKDAVAIATHLMSTTAAEISLENSGDLSKFLLPDQMGVVEELAKEVSSVEFQNNVLRTMFIDPDEALSGRDQEVADAIKDLLGNRQMTAKEAFEFHYLMHGENTVALAYKATQLLEAHGYSTLAFRMKDHVFSSYSGLAAKEVEDIDNIADKLKLTSGQKTELRNMKLYLADHGVDLLYKTMEKYVALCVDHPVIMGLLHSYVFGGAAYAGYSAIRWDNITRFAEARTEAELEKWIKDNAGLDPSDPEYIKKLEQLKKQARALQPEVQAMVDQHVKIGRRSALLRVITFNAPRPSETWRGPGLRRAGDQVVRSFTSGELSSIARTLKNNIHLEGDAKKVAEMMTSFGSVAEVAEAMHDAGYEPDQIKEAISQQAHVHDLAARQVGNVDTTLGKGWGDMKSAELELKVLDGRKRQKGKKKGGGKRG